MGLRRREDVLAWLTFCDPRHFLPHPIVGKMKAASLPEEDAAGEHG